MLWMEIKDFSSSVCSDRPLVSCRNSAIISA
jgi:hypothetical protein